MPKLFYYSTLSTLKNVSKRPSKEQKTSKGQKGYYRLLKIAEAILLFNLINFCRMVQRGRKRQTEAVLKCQLLLILENAVPAFQLIRLDQPWLLGQRLYLLLRPHPKGQVQVHHDIHNNDIEQSSRRHDTKQTFSITVLSANMLNVVMLSVAIT